MNTDRIDPMFSADRAAREKVIPVRIVLLLVLVGVLMYDLVLALRTDASFVDAVKSNVGWLRTQALPILGTVTIYYVLYRVRRARSAG